MRPIGAHVSIAGGVSTAITNVLKIEGTCLQIFAGSPRVWFRAPFPADQVSHFLSAQKEHRLGPVFIHALYLVNLASSNSELLEKSTTSLIMDLQNGARLKSSGVIVHIGSHLGEGFESVKTQLVTVIQRILAETSDCDFILENSAGQKGKIGTLSELSYLIHQVPDQRLKICLDTAHLFASGTDLRSASHVNVFLKELRDLHLLDRLVCLHLNDSASEFDSHRDLHANIGEGKIGLENLKSLINHPDLTHLPLILEVPGENRSGPDLKNILLVKGLVS